MDGRYYFCFVFIYSFRGVSHSTTNTGRCKATHRSRFPAFKIACSTSKVHFVLKSSQLILNEVARQMDPGLTLFFIFGFSKKYQIGDSIFGQLIFGQLTIDIWTIDMMFANF